MATQKGADDPWLPLGLGSITTVIGLVLVVVATSADRGDAMVWVGFAIAGLGSVVMLTGVIGLGVLIAMRAHVREQR